MNTGLIAELKVSYKTNNEEMYGYGIHKQD